MSLLFSDMVWFCVLHLLLACLAATAVLKTTQLFAEGGPVSAVYRGDKSRNFLSAVAGTIISVFIAQIFEFSTFPNDGKVLLFSLDIFIVFYLCLINGWSTNKLIGLLVSFELKNFNSH